MKGHNKHYLADGIALRVIDEGQKTGSTRSMITIDTVKMIKSVDFFSTKRSFVVGHSHSTAVENGLWTFRRLADSPIVSEVSLQASWGDEWCTIAVRVS